MNAKKAFTLIELLVVIAIIAILAAILFPVFAQAKAAAKRTVALSDAKQINLGTMMYEGDVDDTLPYTGAYGDNNSVGMPVLLAPYVQKVKNSVVDTSENTPGLWLSPLDNPAVQTYAGFPITPATGQKLTKQTFQPIYWTSGGFDRAAWGTFTSNDGIHYYIPGKSGTIFPDPGGTFLMTETANPSAILGSNFPGVKRPYDPVPSKWPGNPSGINPGGVYGGADCLTPGNPSGGSNAQPCAKVTNANKPAGLGGGQEIYSFADGHVKTMEIIGTMGKGTNGVGKEGNPCNVIYPCGPWTLDETD